MKYGKPLGQLTEDKRTVASLLGDTLDEERKGIARDQSARSHSYPSSVPHDARPAIFEGSVDDDAIANIAKKDVEKHARVYMADLRPLRKLAMETDESELSIRIEAPLEIV